MWSSTKSVTTQESDVEALTGNGPANCLQGWFASLDRSGDQILGVPTVATASVAVLPGERAVGFRAVVETRIENAEVLVNEELVVLGAGRVEVGLVIEARSPGDAFDRIFTAERSRAKAGISHILLIHPSAGWPGRAREPFPGGLSRWPDANLREHPLTRKIRRHRR